MRGAWVCTRQAIDWKLRGPTSVRRLRTFRTVRIQQSPTRRCPIMYATGFRIENPASTGLRRASVHNSIGSRFRRCTLQAGSTRISKDPSPDTLHCAMAQCNVSGDGSFEIRVEPACNVQRRNLDPIELCTDALRSPVLAGFSMRNPVAYRSEERRVGKEGR